MHGALLYHFWIIAFCYGGPNFPLKKLIKLLMRILLSIDLCMEFVKGTCHSPTHSLIL